MDELLRHASQITAVGYFGVLTVLALVESFVPRRPPDETLAVRWFANVALAVLNTVMIRVAFPIAGLALAVLCLERGWGLFHVLTLPAWLTAVTAVVLLDLAVYVQHCLFHRVGFLWRLHRAHHTDQEFDVTTGLRFHPLESVFATSITLLVILATGAPPIAVLTWQVLSTALNFLEHANVRIPARVDSVLRLLLVTPDMHRIHHSAAARESRANLANMFSWWDRLFGTYLAEPAAGHERMVFGLTEFAEPKHLKVHWILAQPFLSGRPAGPATLAPADTPDPVMPPVGARH